MTMNEADRGARISASTRHGPAAVLAWVAILLMGLPGSTQAGAARFDAGAPVPWMAGAEPARRSAFERIDWRPYYHCHNRRGYRRWCHQGQSGYGAPYDWRRGSRYYGRPYYPRRTWRRRYWPRKYYRRRYDRDRPYWRRQPYRTGPSIYQAI